MKVSFNCGTHHKKAEKGEFGLDVENKKASCITVGRELKLTEREHWGIHSSGGVKWDGKAWRNREWQWKPNRAERKVWRGGGKVIGEGAFINSECERERENSTLHILSTRHWTSVVTINCAKPYTTVIRFSKHLPNANGWELALLVTSLTFARIVRRWGERSFEEEANAQERELGYRTIGLQSWSHCLG